MVQAEPIRTTATRTANAVACLVWASARDMVTRTKDGGTWRIETDAEVAWIADGTSMGRTITAAIPPVFAAYATVVVAYGEERVSMIGPCSLC